MKDSSNPSLTSMALANQLYSPTAQRNHNPAPKSPRDLFETDNDDRLTKTEEITTEKLCKIINEVLTLICEDLGDDDNANGNDGMKE